jgi:predicted metal-dependent hydrolase
MPEPSSPAHGITLAGREVRYSVRRSPRARRIGLHVSPARGLEVVVPARGRLPDIPALLREKAAWIVRALDRVAAQGSPQSAPLHDGTLLPYRGEDHRLVIRAAPDRRAAVARDGAAGTITVTLPDAADPPAPILEWWYREEARAALNARAQVFAAALGVTYAHLTIRDGRSRWGSCSSAGSLNFSWRLILAPPAVLDYVVIHELAHRRELNHSPRFWAIVAAHCPDHRAHQCWLRDHGAVLMAVLRAGEGQ